MKMTEQEKKPKYIMTKSIIYINGINASKKDLQQLENDLKSGKQQATARTTKKGNISIKTNN